MLRRRFRASFAVMLTAAYLVSSIGCTTGRLPPPPAFALSTAAPPAALDRTAAPPSGHAGLRRLPSVAETGPVSQASFAGGDPLYANVAVSPRACFEPGELDLDAIVRGQDQFHGPLKDFLFNPYVIGALIVAGIVIPLAVDPRDRPLGAPGAGTGSPGP